jgi:hypothetical protein
MKDGLGEAMILAILAEAAGTGPVVPTIPTYDYRTGRVYFPGQEKRRRSPRAIGPRGSAGAGCRRRVEERIGGSEYVAKAVEGICAFAHVCRGRVCQAVGCVENVVSADG